MSAPYNLRMPLSDFLLEANRLAGAVARHAEQLSAASRGRIGAHTAVEMQKLAEEILRIERERDRKVVGPIRPLIRRAEALIAEIGKAAKFIAVEKPMVAEQLRRVRSEGRGRSAFAAAWALDMHLGLVRQHPEEFAAVLPADFMNEAARAVASIEQHRDTRKAATQASSAQTRMRDERVADLQQIISGVRVLGLSVFLHGEIAQEFLARPR